ncbi:Tetratricopeptide TPR_2 repeat protein [Candidatus Magnetobacterium bavaricum]|uniref:Tetratricopeptide TPR_2 repeat protein n=1 Tax=Candidatus Magnetobacterium bavaricum TaxID=29290 RepID=A0A0F3GTG6_9BACT|nr:Tetratricopeptide TPR_2 repeat protein [Candidatus Magnetobacterium bavaricum]
MKKPKEKKQVEGEKRIGINDIITISLVLLTLMVFLQVKDFEFIIYDDNLYVTDNKWVQDGLSLQGLRWAFTTFHASNWHPLTWLTHMLDVEIYGLNSSGHHTTNLFLHIVNVILTFVLLTELTGAVLRSALVAALFALHPMHVESVAWVSERKDVLSTLFFLCTIIAYVRYVKKPMIGKYLLIIGLYVLGLLSKPMVVTLPFVLLLLDIWPLKRISFALKTTADAQNKLQTPGSLIMEKLPLFVLSILSSIVTYYAQKVGGSVVMLKVLPLSMRLKGALHAYLSYVVKVFYPYEMSVMYPVYEKYGNYEMFFALFLMITISLAAIKMIKRHPHFFVGWAWYVGMLVPVIGLVHVGSQTVSDRYTYIPYMGLFMIVAWFIPDKPFKKTWPKRFLLSFITIYIMTLAVLSYKQTSYWRNSLILFQHATPIAYNNWELFNNLGTALSGNRRVNEAIESFKKSISLNPVYIDPHVNIGVAYYSLGKTQEARESFERALKINPKNAAVYNGQGVILASEGKKAEARAMFNRALEIDPEFQPARQNLNITKD